MIGTIATCLAGGELAVASCGANPHTTAERQDARPPVVLTTYDNEQVLDVDPPQRLDVLMTFDNTPAGSYWRTLCDDMGGSLTWNGDNTATCEGVDY